MEETNHPSIGCETARTEAYADFSDLSVPGRNPLRFCILKVPLTPTATNRYTPRARARAAGIAPPFHETYDLFFTASLDGGATFSAPVRITSQSSKPLPKHASRFWPGADYMFSSAASDGTFHLLWPDARTGIFQLYTSVVRLR